ncbi:MAG: O-methyltransferase [Longimicrobiales bacterium]
MKLAKALQAMGVALRNLALGGNAAALSLAGDPRRMVHYASESLFLHRAMADRRGLPQRHVAQVLGDPGEVSVRLGSLNGDGWPRMLSSYTVDLVSLCLLCRLIEPRVVFEIGTFHGYSSYHLALNTEPDAIVYTLDLPRTGASPALRTTVMDDAHINGSAGPHGYCFERSSVAHKIRCLDGDSATFDFSPYHQQVDLFFIDGAHSYDYVRSDSQCALECTRPGGVVAWHDFGRAGVNGVTRRLLELRREGHELYAVPGGSLAFMVVRDCV